MLSPDRIALEAIYAAPFHNKRSSGPGDGMDKSYDEILRLLDRMGRSPAGFVFKGVRDFVGPAKQARKAEAVDHLIARARASSPDDPLCIIAIAAISNVASALLAAPDIADKVIVVWLGGHALEWPDTREFNLRQDVGGAQVLLDSGAPLVLIPCMGVTSHLHSTVPEIERCVEPHGEIGKFLAATLQGILGRPCRLVEGNLGHGAGRLAHQSGLGADGACADANSDRPGDLERRSDSPTHALCDNRET